MADSLKVFFNRQVVEGIAADFAVAHAGFDREQFARDCLQGLERLELLARGWHIAEVLRRHLPQDFEAASRILLRSLPSRTLSGMETFRYLPHMFYISKYGIGHFEAAMLAQYELTQRFTAEFGAGWNASIPSRSVVRTHDHAKIVRGRASP
jgi:hypothetical protein